jgi:hypothetical protein
MSHVPALLRLFPFTIALFCAFIAIGVLTGGIPKSDYSSIRSYVGWDLDTLRAGYYWRQIPNTLVPASPGIKWHEPLLLVLFAGALEYRAGSLVAFATFFVSDWISSPLTVLTVWGLSALGSSTAAGALQTPSTGSSAASLACGAAAACLMPGRWSVFAVGIILGIVLHSFTYQAFGTSLAHLYATSLGALAGLMLWSRRPEKLRPFHLARFASDAPPRDAA